MNKDDNPDEHYKWHVLSIVLVGTMMAALDSSIVNVSIPAIMDDFNANLEDVEWVVSSYMLGFAVSMPLTAWLRDRLGHKNLYIGCLALFTIGSLLCGFAWNLHTLIIARVIQAFGGGALTPTGMAMISDSFAPHERAKALGYWGLGAIMGPTFGPTLGGILTQYWGWPSIFLINLPIGAIAIVMAYKVIRRDSQKKANRRPFDLLGFSLLTIFLVSFLLMMTKGASKGWSTLSFIVTLIISLISFVLFLISERHVRFPILNLKLLQNAVFRSCFLLSLLRSLALYGGTFLLPIFMQNLMKLDELTTGLILLPGSLVMGLMMPVGGKLSERIGPRGLSFIGFFFLALFFLLLLNLRTDSTPWEIILPTLIRGLGIALLMPSLLSTGLNALPNNQSGMASTMLNIIQQIGGAMGIAILTMVVHLSVSDANSAPVTEQVAGFQNAFIVGVFLTLLGILAAFGLPKRSAE